MRTEQVAKAIVTNSAGQVLLLRRSKDDTRRPGDWDFPGGGVEAGEGFRVATARELHEEAGIKVSADQLKLIYMGTEFWEPEEITYFRCLYTYKLRDNQTITLSHEHDAYEWMDVPQALAAFTHIFYNAGLRYAYEHGLLQV